jgi:hypothetical protein
MGQQPQEEKLIDKKKFVAEGNIFNYFTLISS